MFQMTRLHCSTDKEKDLNYLQTYFFLLCTLESPCSKLLGWQGVFLLFRISKISKNSCLSEKSAQNKHGTLSWTAAVSYTDATGSVVQSGTGVGVDFHGGMTPTAPSFDLDI